MRALLPAAAGRQTHCSCCALEGVVMTPTHAHPRSFKTNRHRLEISATTILQCKSLYASYPHGWNGHVRMKLAAAGRQTPQSCCAVEGVDMTPTHARPRSFKTKRHRLEISAKPFTCHGILCTTQGFARRARTRTRRGRRRRWRPTGAIRNSYLSSPRRTQTQRRSTNTKKFIVDCRPTQDKRAA